VNVYRDSIESGVDCGGPVVLLVACESVAVGVSATRQWGNKTGRRRNEKKNVCSPKRTVSVSEIGEGLPRL